MPFKSAFELPNSEGKMEKGVICCYVISPISSSNGDNAGYFAWRIDPDLAYARILEAAQGGKTGETFTFNKEGLIQSRSRFPDQVATKGLLVDANNANILQF